MQNDAERQFPKNPQPRRAKGIVLALLGACVIFSVALIGHTHPPFPAPKVRRRDEATDGGLGGCEIDRTPPKSARTTTTPSS